MGKEKYVEVLSYDIEILHVYLFIDTNKFGGRTVDLKERFSMFRQSVGIFRVYIYIYM